VSAVDDIIKQWVQRAERSGEIRKLPGFGEPFQFEDGFMETPAELRMAHKILKNAGYVPAEIEMLQRLAALRDQLKVDEDPVRQSELKSKIADLEQKVAIMLDALRGRR